MENINFEISLKSTPRESVLLFLFYCLLKKKKKERERSIKHSASSNVSSIYVYLNPPVCDLEFIHDKTWNKVTSQKTRGK